MGWVRKLEGPRGIRYKAGYWTPDHKVKSKSFKRKADADQWVTNNEADKNRGQWTDPEIGRKPLRTVYEEMHAARSYAPATVAVHGDAWAHVPERIRDRSICDITRGDIDALLGKVEGAPAMRAKVQALLSTLYNWAEFTPNPASRRKRTPTRAEKMERHALATKKRHYLSDADLVGLLNATPARYRALIELMARMGLRPGEAYALTVGKFDPLKRTLLIDSSVTGFTKTGESRKLVLPEVIADTLVAHIKKFSDDQDPDALVFPSERKVMIDAGNWRRRVFDVATEAAGLSDLTPNSLRHSAVSFAVANGATVYAVQRMVGHAKPSITLDVYGELWDESQETLAETLDAAIRVARKAKPTEAKVLKLA